MNRLDYLIQYLINEDPQYIEMRIPEDLQGKRDLFRALRNVREPRDPSARSSCVCRTRNCRNSWRRRGL